MNALTRAQWIAIAAHRLQHRWRTVAPAQLDDLAGELYDDVSLRDLDPVAAVDAWLAPISRQQALAPALRRA